MFSSVHVQFTFFSQTDKHPLISSVQFMFSSLPTSRTTSPGVVTRIRTCAKCDARAYTSTDTTRARVSPYPKSLTTSLYLYHTRVHATKLTHRRCSHIELVAGGRLRVRPMFTGCSCSVHVQFTTRARTLNIRVFTSVQFSSVHVQFSPKIREHRPLQSSSREV